MRARLRYAGAQLEGRRRGRPPRRAGRVHRDVRVGQIVARLRHHLRRGAAPVLRVRRPIRAAPAAARPARRRWTTSPGLPPAVALQQRRGSATSRSTVGTVTTLSNLLRMLFSRAGTYPRGATERLDSDAFSPNTAIGACPECHGLGRIHQVTEQTLVPDPSLTIREGAVAAWPGAWQGQNLRDILITLGYDIDKPWRKLPKRQRDWILFTDEQPTVEIDPEPAPGHGGLLLQRHLLQRRTPRPAHAGQLAERDDAPPRPAVRRQRRMPGCATVRDCGPRRWT